MCRIPISDSTASVFGVDIARRLGPRADGLPRVTQARIDDRLRHLRAAGIAGAEEKHLAFHAGGLHRLCQPSGHLGRRGDAPRADHLLVDHQAGRRQDVVFHDLVVVRHLDEFGLHRLDVVDGLPGDASTFLQLAQPEPRTLIVSMKASFFFLIPIPSVKTTPGEWELPGIGWECAIFAFTLPALRQRIAAIHQP